MQPDTYAAGVRRSYQSLPAEVQAWVAAQLGGPVVSVQNMSGGFSPGVAAVVASRDTRLFVKAAGSAVNLESVRLYEQEGRVGARLPRLDGLVAPLAAEVIVVAGERYALLAYPALVGSTPQHPWRAADLDATLTALHRLSTELTPSPWSTGRDDHRLSGFFTGWQRLGVDSDDPWQTDDWVGPRLADAAAIEEELRLQLDGNTLSHIDLRADNIVLTTQGVCFVDWAHAENAAPWVDAGLLISDVIASRADHVDGGEVDVRSVIRQHPQLGDVPFATVWALQLSMAGALHSMSRRPAPTGLPTIRGWQGLTAETLLGWCRRNTIGQ